MTEIVIDHFDIISDRRICFRPTGAIFQTFAASETDYYVVEPGRTIDDLGNRHELAQIMSMATKVFRQMAEQRRLHGRSAG